ncbi:hypothetical protein BDQ17DRAFT_1044612 [Cyathus striatus]|nr:hypothetical protein BDQ17DRAFT_1044612 [Cyathus striatus]
MIFAKFLAFTIFSLAGIGQVSARARWLERNNRAVQLHLVGLAGSNLRFWINYEMPVLEKYVAHSRDKQLHLFWQLSQSVLNRILQML